MRVLLLILAVSSLALCQDSFTVSKMLLKVSKTAPYTPEQITHAKVILQACVPFTNDLNKLSYVVGTAIFETGLKSFKERRCSPTESCYRSQEKYWYTGYWGRGYVPLIGQANYAKFGQLLGVDLVGNPDLALRPDIAGKIICMGMNKGLFTGYKLSDFFFGSEVRWDLARKIIKANSEKAADVTSIATLINKMN